MRALIQRVSKASVSVEGMLKSEINSGLCVFLGVKNTDSLTDAETLARKVVQLRIFPDKSGKMNLNVNEDDGALLIVSQFTLLGDTSKGNRPSYSRAAKAEVARALYEHFVSVCRRICPKVETGVFQAHMDVELINDGPVTLLCYSGE